MEAYEIQSRNRFLEISHSIILGEAQKLPKVTTLSEVDLTEIESIRTSAVERGIDKPGYTAFVVKAVALALREFPYANRRVCRSVWPLTVGVRFQKFEEIDVTVAVERDVPDAEMAAFVDIVRRADRLSIGDIQVRLNELATSDVSSNKQWRDYSNLVTRFPMWFARLMVKLPLFIPNAWYQYRGGAAMVSSPGKYGVDVIFTNWWAPLSFSFGVVKQRPLIKEGRVKACPTFILTVSFDVRVMAGAKGAIFAKRVIDILENAGSEMKEFLSYNSR